MNPSPQALQLLLERAEAERDTAQLRAARAAEQARQLALQAEQLAAYRDEYRRRAPALGGRDTSIEILRCHRDFMQRLEQAIAQQRQQFEASEREATARREVLLDCEMRVAAVRKLIERRAQEHRRHQSRLEQRRSDEAAARAAWSAHGTPTTH